MSMPLTLTPRPDGDALTWDAPAPAARLFPVSGGWRYQRDGQEPSPVLPPDAPARLRWEVRLGAGVVVAHLDLPVLLVTGGRVERWLALRYWLALVLDAEGPTLDEVRPALRRTLLGSPARGVVLPCVSATTLSGPDDPALPAGCYAARVRVENRADEAAVLRRVPVHEPSLTLWASGHRVAAGDMVVSLSRDDSAEARASVAQAPPGFTQVAGPSGPWEGLGLAWLHDSTRRGLEFHP